MESFYSGHARKTCVSAYQILRIESQKYGKLCHFWKKGYRLHQNHSSVVLLCCCAKKIVRCFWIFFVNLRKWHEEGAIKDSSCDATTEGPQGKSNKVITSCYARRKWQAPGRWTQKQVGRRLQIAVSEVLRTLADNALTQHCSVHLWLVQSAS